MRRSNQLFRDFVDTLPRRFCSDIRLPEIDGYELAGRLRAIAQPRQLHLVAVTGYGQEEDRQRAQAAGFDSHLVKPVDLAELQRILAGLPANGGGTTSALAANFPLELSAGKSTIGRPVENTRAPQSP